jgi:hypothetical protein
MCLALIHWSSCCLRSDCKAAVKLLSGYEQTGDAIVILVSLASFKEKSPENHEITSQILGGSFGFSLEAIVICLQLKQKNLISEGDGTVRVIT